MFCALTAETLNIWSQILEYLPFKSVLLTLETGDSRIQHIVRSALKHLELNRKQRQFKPFPISFLNSWNNIQSLLISVENEVYQSITGFLVMPPSLRSLTILTNEFGINAVLSVLQSSFVTFEQAKNLTHLTIGNRDNNVVAWLSEDNSCMLASIIKRLPLVSLMTSELMAHVSVLYSLPPTLKHLHMSVFADLTIVYSAPALPTNLLTLHIETYPSRSDICWSSPLIIPPNVTNLQLTLPWMAVETKFPTELNSLVMCSRTSGNSSWGIEQLNLLPSMLTSLTVKNSLPEHLLRYLPAFLRTLIQSERPMVACNDPSLLPASLTELGMYSFDDSSDWIHLPRGIRKLDPVIEIRYKKQFPNVMNLPPCLEAVDFTVMPSAEVLRTIPSKNVLKSLVIGSGISNDDTVDSEFLTAFMPFGNDSVSDGFTSLCSLKMTTQFFDLSKLNDVFLPSLTTLKIVCNHLNDDEPFNIKSRLLYLSLKSKSIFHRKLSVMNVLSCLPPSLKTLKMEQFTVESSEYLIILPKSLVELRLSIPSSAFSFEHLSELSNTVTNLNIRLVTNKKSDVICLQSSLKTILTSLPKCIESFNCTSSDSVSVWYTDCYMVPDKTYLQMKDEIFSKYAPSFLHSFYAPTLNPDIVWDPATPYLSRANLALI